jgi:hypothetical protein
LFYIFMTLFVVVFLVVIMPPKKAMKKKSSKKKSRVVKNVSPIADGFVPVVEETNEVAIESPIVVKDELSEDEVVDISSSHDASGSGGALPGDHVGGSGGGIDGTDHVGGSGGGLNGTGDELENRPATPPVRGRVLGQSPRKKRNTSSRNIPEVSSSSVSSVTVSGAAVGNVVNEADVVKVFVLGHSTSSRPSATGSFVTRRLVLVYNKKSVDTIPGGFGKFVIVVLKGWGNVKHHATAAQQVSSLVPGMMYTIRVTKNTRFGQVKFNYAPTWSPNNFEVMLGDGNLLVPCTTPLSKDLVFLTDRTKISELETLDHGYNSWFLAVLGDKDILQDGAQGDALVRLVYDESGKSVMLTIWDEDSPLAHADTGTIVIFSGFVNQKAQYPKKLTLISGGVLDMTSFIGEASFMTIDAPPVVPEYKFLPCITEFNLMAYFACRPESGVRVLHALPFTFNTLEDDVDYVDFLCPTCAKKLSRAEESGVLSCPSHGIIDDALVELVCHPLCRLSVRLGCDDSPEHVFVTSATLAKNQELVVFGHSCEDICNGADLLPHDGVKFTGTFFISVSGISVDNVRRVVVA